MEDKKMKSRKVSYSFRMADGKVVDFEGIVIAPLIMEALNLALREISLKADSTPKVVDHAIWEIRIIQDVF